MASDAKIPDDDPVYKIPITVRVSIVPTDPRMEVFDMQTRAIGPRRAAEALMIAAKGYRDALIANGLIDEEDTRDGE